MAVFRWFSGGPKRRNKPTVQQAELPGAQLAQGQFARDQQQHERAAARTSIEENDRAYRDALRAARGRMARLFPDRLAPLHQAIGASPRLALSFVEQSRATLGWARARPVLSLLVLLIFMPFGLAFAAPGVLERVYAPILRVLPESRVVAQTRANVACSELTAYSGRDGGIVDVAPRTPECPSHHETVPVSLETALLQMPMMAAVEGDFDGPGRVLTLDFEGLARSVYYRFDVGGTPPDQTAIEYAYGLFDDGENPIRYTLRKLAMTFYHAPQYAARYLPTVEERVQFAVSHMGCANGVRYTGPTIPPVAGHFCAALVGETTLDHLSLAQRCLIEGARAGQVRVPGPHASAERIQETYIASWETARRRAIDTCVPDLLEGVELDAAVAELEAMRPPSLEWLRAFLRGEADPVPGASSFHAVILPEGGESPLSAEAQQALQAEVADELAHLDLRFANGLCPPSAPDCADADMLDVGIVVVPFGTDGATRPAAIYQSRANLLTTVEDPLRSQASLVKALLVPLLVQFGVTDLCRQYVGVLQDAGGYMGRDCGTDPEVLSLSSALGQSSNLAFLDGLNDIPDDALRGYLDTFGFRGHEDLSGLALRRAVLIGDQVTISVDAMIAAFMTLSTGTPMVGPFRTDPRMAEPVPASTFFDASVLATAQGVLAESGTSPGGTARHAAQDAALLGCRFWNAKTGTADGNNGLARDRLLIGVVTCGARSALVYGVIGSPDPARDLGDTITAREVNRLIVRAAMAALRGLHTEDLNTIRNPFADTPDSDADGPLAPIASPRPHARPVTTDSFFSSSNP